MNVSLVMFTQAGERRDFDIQNETSTFGRASECNFQIALPVISRQHCQLTVKNDKVTVRDLGSSNGTLVNDKRVQEAELHVGDTLTIGPVIFTVVIDGRPTDIKPIKTLLDRKSGGGARPAAPKADKEKKIQDDLDADLELSLEDSATLDVLPEEDQPANPLAELEALSRQRKS